MVSLIRSFDTIKDTEFNETVQVFHAFDHHIRPLLPGHNLVDLFSSIVMKTNEKQIVTQRVTEKSQRATENKNSCQY